jgi:large subunit ribosomal protein L13
MIVDADKAILGRLASRVARELLRGQEIIVINIEKAIISGNEDNIADRYLAKIHRGDPHKGPFYPRYPDRIFRRMIRSMLPYKHQRGKEALKLLKIHIGNPENLQGEKIAKTADDLKSKYVSLHELSKRLGAHG